jgi:hypothetical protein
LVAAGPAIYYGFPSEQTIEIEAGPSELDRIDAADGFYRRGTTGLYGPTVGRRCWAAREGLAVGPRELDRERHLFERRRRSVRTKDGIEEILPAPPAGPQTSARALAEWLWRGMQIDGDWNTWPWIRKYVPSLADADGRREYPKRSIVLRTYVRSTSR